MTERMYNLKRIIFSLLIIASFSIIWVNTVFQKFIIGNSLGLFLGILIPIILLIGILQYKNKFCYWTVLIILAIAILFEVKYFASYYKFSQIENPEMLCSCNPFYEMKRNTKHILVGLIGLILMSTNVIINTYANAKRSDK
ncbi:MAG: hypothetical protein ACJATI_001523 [Halioglobus sp.]|jgi:uncharacterized protein YacL